MEPSGTYGIPLDIESFFATRRFEVRSIQRSVAEHIHLLLITSKDEYEFDPEFGCEVWDNDFEAIGSMPAWLDRVAEDLRSRLTIYEKRLREIELSVDHVQAEFFNKDHEKVASRLKRKLTVRLVARLASTNEVFRFEDVIYMSPFSLD